MKGSITPDDYSTGESLSRAGSLFVGNITEETQGDKCVLEVRNKIHAGDTLETLSPDGTLSTKLMPEPLELTDGQNVDFANNSQFILLDDPLKPYTILRRLA
jgi:hypothetical protein